VSIVLENVSKEYPGGVVAVDDVTLEVEHGEFMVLVGPSGCGKTTLMRMIAGLERTSAGRILIDGRDVTDMAPRHRDLAMVFQNYALYPHMTVRRNLAYGLKVRKTPKQELDARVEEVACLLGLDELLERKPGALSGGQRQRVAMGRAIIREPIAYLMDEPLSNLDAKLRVGMRAELSRLHERLGTTTVYVTHDQVEAMTLGQRVTALRDGVIQQVGTPRELYRDPVNLFVAAFLGSPSMNLVQARVEDGEVRFGQLAFPLDPGRRPSRDGEVILGIRPGDLQDADLSAPGSSRITVDVAVVEELGSLSHVFFWVDGQAVEADDLRAATDVSESTLLADEGRCLFAAAVDARTRARPGGKVSLAVDPAAFHFFDPSSGASLCRTGRAEGAPPPAATAPAARC
jgi:multiple sugar transport system ATP-binding protein